MLRIRKPAIPTSERRELDRVKARLDKLEPRVNFLEEKYKLMTRKDNGE